ncbi:hypothetical protein E2I00_014173, partial [Balaenoptera physalus]
MKVSEQECDPLLGMLPTESEGWRRAPRGAGGQGPSVEAMSVQTVVLAAGPPVARVCQLALRNALRYFPPDTQELLAPEFAQELRLYGHIYMYRFCPDIEMKAYPVEQYPCRTRVAAAIMHMIMNNLDPAVAQFPQELVTYGGNGQVFGNWAQVIPNYSSRMEYEKLFAMGVTIRCSRSHSEKGTSSRPDAPVHSVSCVLPDIPCVCGRLAGVSAINRLAQENFFFWDYGNAFLLEAQRAGDAGSLCTGADVGKTGANRTEFRYPSYVQHIMGDIFSQGFGPFRWVCTSGDPQDLVVTDELATSVLEEAIAGGADLLCPPTLQAPVVLSRDHHDVSGTDSPFRETSNICDGSAFCA